MENNAPKKKQLPAFLILTIIAVVAAVVLAFTNMITAGPIAEHAMAALKEAFNAVMPAESYEEMTVPAEYDVSSLYVAKNGDEVVGYCVTASGMGYGGPVAVTLGVDPQGVVAGCSVGDTSFAETAGFGMRAKEPAFQDQFPGISAIDGGAFEALSGATVTSEAVRAATNKGLKCVAEVALGKTPNADPLVVFGAPAGKPAGEEKPAAQPLTGAVQEGTAKGFQSDVKVQLTVENGVIAGLTIDSANETSGFGTRCAEDEAFINQFIGQAGPFTLGENIDALSGATVTSTAVVEAVNAALSTPASAGGETVTGTAKGFQSDVTVTITVENGAIASMMIDSAAETSGFGTRCAEDEAFINQFIGKAAPLTLGEGIDALSGATVTSTAVVEAANAALANVGAAEAPVTILAEGENGTVGVNADGAAVVAPAEGFTGEMNVLLTVEDGKVVSGEFAAPGAEPAPADNIIGTAQGFQSEVNVSVTLNEDGTIAALSIGSADETSGFGTRCATDEAFINQFIGKKGPFVVGEGIDVLSGATVTSNAVIEALNVAMAADVAVEEAPADATASATAAATGTVEAAPAGETFTGTAKGFQSDVTVTVTVADGVITSIKVDSAAETSGFGTRCAEDEAFLNQFIGKEVAEFKLGENVDALSGATVTSQAVVDAINSSSTVAASAEAAPAGETFTGTAKGFQSDVTVTVTVDGGVITSIKVDSAAETSGFGTRCGEDEAFLNQFVGKNFTPDVGEGIDALSGATVTSNAVVDAINAAMGVAVAVEEVPADTTASATGTVEEAPAAEVAAPVTGTAKGYQSDVKVNVIVDEAGKIVGLSVDSTGETSGFGTRCGEDAAFLTQFLGKTAPVALGEGIDALSGATVTSNAVVDAINAVLEK
ncbi:MAG: FMN-binding protein [Clostridia bacterium]|nr:FMN-binding protein [Clostridia bacterium]